MREKIPEYIGKPKRLGRLLIKIKVISELSSHESRKNVHILKVRAEPPHKGLLSLKTTLIGFVKSYIYRTKRRHSFTVYSLKHVVLDPALQAGPDCDGYMQIHLTRII